MKTIAVTAAAIISAAWLATPEIELRLALRGAGHQHPSIVMLGDSHTDFVNWKILARCRNTANLGVGGNTTAQMLARLPAALALSPRLVIVMGGTNDALQSVDASVTTTNLRQMEDLASARGVRFVSLTPPPFHGRSIEVGALAVPFTADDILADGIHLRASGYAKWRDAIAPIVREYC